MTDAEIEAALRRLTPAQRRMLTAMLQGRTPSLSLKPLQIVDALVRKKLVLAPWADARCLRLVYEPPALVATLARRLWAVPAPEDPSHA